MNDPHTAQLHDQSDAPGFQSKDRFTLYSAKDFPHLPELTWLIDDVLPSSGLASVYGNSGAGKSFVCLDMAASVASGRDWFGHRTKRRQVVYIVLEGQAGFRRRVAAWEKHNEMAFPSDVKFVFDSFSLSPNDHALQLGKLIKEDDGAGLVVVDTLNKAASGMDENSSSDMGSLIEGASILQHMTGGLVLLVHHPGKDASRGLRGHSSLYAALDTVIEVERDGQVIRWRLVKSKDGEDRIAHAFKLLQVEVGQNDYGKPLTSCVIQEVEGYSVQQLQIEPRGNHQKVILAEFKSLMREKQMLCAATGDEWPDGIAFDEAVNQLKLKLDGVDPGHRQTRAKAALERLVQMGYLSRSSGGFIHVSS